jgi:hypothetical protein
MTIHPSSLVVLLDWTGMKWFGSGMSSSILTLFSFVLRFLLLSSFGLAEARGEAAGEVVLVAFFLLPPIFFLFFPLG